MFQEMVKVVAISVGALTTFLHFSEFVVVSEDEKMINEKIEQSQEIVMTAMGFDPEEDEDEEDDIEEDEEPDTGVIDLPEEEDQSKVIELIKS
jgi:hypothetical protein